VVVFYLTGLTTQLGTVAYGIVLMAVGSPIFETFIGRAARRTRAARNSPRKTASVGVILYPAFRAATAATSSPRHHDIAWA